MTKSEVFSNELTFETVVMSCGFDDVSVEFAREYADNKWIFVTIDPIEEEWTVNLFINGDFAGEPLSSHDSIDLAITYCQGFIQGKKQ